MQPRTSHSIGRIAVFRASPTLFAKSPRVVAATASAATKPILRSPRHPLTRLPGLLKPIAAFLILIGMNAGLLSAQVNVSNSPSLRFHRAGTSGFTFDTGVLRGKLRADSKARGLSDVEHIASGAKLDRSAGLFGHYRVFTASRRYGTAAWDWPGEAELQPDGSVVARWPVTGERPFELRATYRWAAPNALDVVTTVQATTNLAGFESFLACYFADNFTNSLAYVAELPGKPGVAGFLVAKPSLGTWLAFPRDDAAMAIFRDGRWALQPHPVEWVKMPRLAKPLGIRRDPASGLTALIMAPPTDAFALCTPEQTEGHYSMYLSLFGCDLKAGEVARARARLVIADELSESVAVKAYESYLKELSAD